MVDDETITAWTWRTQLLHGPFRDPVTVLGRVSGVYSSHPTAPLALAARTPDFDLASYRLLDQNRAAVRVPGVRRSKFLLPVDLAATHVRATRLPLDKHHWRLEQAGIPVADYAYWRSAVLEVTGEPATTREIRKRLIDKGHADVPRGLPAVVATMSYESVLVRSASRSMLADQVAYVATTSWLGAPLPEIDRAQALRDLVRGYLRSHGPVGVADIAWWLGAAQRDVRVVLSELDAWDIGDGRLLAAEDADAFTAFVEKPEPPEGLVLLPPWDGYLMGYPAGRRERLLNPDHERHVYDRAGNALGSVLQRGRVVGTWTLRAGRTATAELTVLPGEEVSRPAFDAALRALEPVLGLPISAVT